MHPDEQAARVAARVNFTGIHDPKLAPCPAEQRRSLGTIEHWGGNVPETPARKQDRDRYWADVERLTAQGQPPHPAEVFYRSFYSSRIPRPSWLQKLLRRVGLV